LIRDIVNIKVFVLISPDLQEPGDYLRVPSPTSGPR